MKTNLNEIASLMNDELAIAGHPDRWELDTDPSSNSVGSWFCGSLGGVMYARSMREATAARITQALAAAEREGRRA